MTEPKTRRSEAEYRRLLAERERSGLTLKAFAESRGIKPQTLYAWHRRLRHAPDSVAIVPVQVVETANQSGVTSERCFEVTISSDCVVSVPPGFDANELARLMSVLGSRC